MKLPPHLLLAVAVAAVLAITLPRGGGFPLAAALMLFMPWALYNLLRMALQPAGRRQRAVRLAAWTGALALGLAVQSYWSHAARGEAQQAADALQAHHARTGAFPPTLREAGQDEAALAQRWKLRYRLLEGRPELHYSSVWMPMTLLEYDFAARQWRVNDY